MKRWLGRWLIHLGSLLTDDTVIFRQGKYEWRRWHPPIGPRPAPIRRPIPWHD